MDNKIIIKKNPNGDTRTAPNGITFEQFHKANESHRDDVYNVMNKLSSIIKETGIKHDWTKSEEYSYNESALGKYEHMFYDDFTKSMKGELNFVEGRWYKMHVAKERHHLLSRCPEDVNLIDVIEMVVDCTVAGLARSGEVRPMEINSDILMKAVENTSKMIQEMVTVDDEQN